MSDNIIWVLLIVTFLIIIGLYLSEYTPLDLSEKEKILKLNIITENFSNNINEESKDVSEYFLWDDNNNKCNHSCNTQCPKPCPQQCPKPPPPPQCPPPVTPQCPPPVQPVANKAQVCQTCDITQNKDINKYVLKSSVPPCPDMSEYVKKNMINTVPNLSDYILKSEVQPCEKVDMSKYILKTEIPACPVCPTCPECPICPVCPPPPPKCKEIHEYDITEHPDYSKYANNMFQEEESKYAPYEEEAKREVPPTNNYYKVTISNPPDAYYAGDSLYATV
jgi:hypothetical protein